jgi:hypothetical protein
MSYMVEHKRKFDDLKFNIENIDQLKRKSNGGNSILFSFPPREERLYIDKAEELYKDQAAFIDLARLLVDFIDDEGWEAFEEYYKTMASSPHKVFHDDEAPETDLFDMIVSNIETASKKGKIPFLLRTGCLYGTGIENQNILEHKTVMALPTPLVIFYPSSIQDGNLSFLNCKSASKYRCTLIK